RHRGDPTRPGAHGRIRPYAAGQPRGLSGVHHRAGRPDGADPRAGDLAHATAQETRGCATRVGAARTATPITTLRRRRGPTPRDSLLCTRCTERERLLAAAPRPSFAIRRRESCRRPNREKARSARLARRGPPPRTGPRRGSEATA